MSRWSLLILLMACGSSDEPLAADAPATGDAPTTTPGEPAELAGITRAHNEVRAMVDTPDALPPLVWDDALAATAAAYVRTCDDGDGDGLIDHNDDRSMGHPFYVGENIYGSTGTSTATAAVASWADEVRSYDAAANTCAAGKICGHYTQIVWRATQKIGCALHRCNLRFASTIICDYGPGGNVGRERPY